MPLFRSLITIAIIVGYNFLCPSVRSQFLQLSNIPKSKEERLQFNPPLTTNSGGDDDSEGRPPNRISGGSRGSCLHQLVALIPSQKVVVSESKDCPTQIDSALALTFSAKPTFWFYVPAKASSQLKAEFILYEGDRAIARQTVPMSETPGIISFQLDRPLEIDKEYRWSFSLLIHPEFPALNPSVAGAIARIQPDGEISDRLKTATSERERIEIYASNGIWYEALTILGELHRANPQDESLEADWTHLLSSVELSAIAAMPMSNCCVLTQKMDDN